MVFHSYFQLLIFLRWNLTQRPPTSDPVRFVHFDGELLFYLYICSWGFGADSCLATIHYFPIIKGYKISSLQLVSRTGLIGTYVFRFLAPITVEYYIASACACLSQYVVVVYQNYCASNFKSNSNLASVELDWHFSFHFQILQNRVHVGFKPSINPGRPGGVSLSRFVKIWEIVQKEVEQAGLGRKTLGTNQMRKELDRLAEEIRLTVQKHIKCSDFKWTQEALLRLIHIEKWNVARRKPAKQGSDGKDDSTAPQTRRRSKPSRDQAGDAETLAPGRSPATSCRPISTSDDHERRLPKKHTNGREYMTTSN